MKKSSFVAMVLGTVSIVLFALGMCMTLISEWDAFLQGIILGCIGILLGLITLIVWRKMEHKAPIRISGKQVLTIAVGTIGVLSFGAGMCFGMVWDWYCRYTIASFSYSSDKRYQRVNIQQKLTGQLTKTTVGKRVISEQRYRMVLSAAVSLSFHFLYALYHGVLGVVHSSLWFITMCAYYAILSVMRFSVVLFEYKNKSKSSADTEYFVMRLSGILLILLSFVLSGVIYISISQNIAVKYDEILMITIAAYTFFKIIMAIVKAVKQHKNPSPLLAVIRNIGYAEAAASILTLQRSMLVSFGTMDNTEAHIMNILTGAAVCLYVLIIGMYLLLKRKNRTKTAI